MPAVGAELAAEHQPPLLLVEGCRDLHREAMIAARRANRQRHLREPGLGAFLNGRIDWSILGRGLRTARGERAQRGDHSGDSAPPPSSTAVRPFEPGAIRAISCCPG